MTRAVRIKGNYELVRADCPACGEENVFNRASDLCTFEPISHLSVECQTKDCRHKFSINGDEIGPAYKTFYYEAYDFVAQKRYSFAILSVVQALELFFAHGVRELWLLKRFRRRGSGDLDELNEALRDLYDRTRKFSYVDMRNLFLRAAVTARPHTVKEGQTLVTSIGNREPTLGDEAFAALPPALSTLLLRMKKLDVHELRNTIAHKQAYRPKREEAETAIETVGDILIPLASKLRVEFDSF